MARFWNFFWWQGRSWSYQNYFRTISHFFYFWGVVKDCCGVSSLSRPIIHHPHSPFQAALPLQETERDRLSGARFFLSPKYNNKNTNIWVPSNTGKIYINPGSKVLVDDLVTLQEPVGARNWQRLLLRLLLKVFVSRSGGLVWENVHPDIVGQIWPASPRHGGHLSQDSGQITEGSVGQT